jgi:uncharacterized protein YcfJ
MKAGLGAELRIFLPFVRLTAEGTGFVGLGFRTRLRDVATVALAHVDGWAKGTIQQKLQRAEKIKKYNTECTGWIQDETKIERVDEEYTKW